ncbi:MAG: hypothetical protein RMZ43_034930 [Nostoc sp. CmiVER01]|uniref:hypothetical protein n=1 Tax=Nostoc sp. CmiVER01 TaxID=3075384 RepID=UPI002AD4CEFD|nr:hypothetical protein [Nostoc sp. CmiVER01]MDZ8126857.1 hypothetical protein [Nostoc sp. CmiVER01]
MMPDCAIAVVTGSTINPSCALSADMCLLPLHLCARLQQSGVRATRQRTHALAASIQLLK